ncbi:MULTISPECIES: phosphoadenosine phosphosulfate reductase family protein [Microvirga]|uniref:phosphoadenosine phosphosulfate reductase family protein n=1 Tax=Microvirga TaxID=186650 RepID=UPI0021C5F641|nr:MULTISPECIES: phosphoadenosine phosphosulfate reductase family protein [unclassified Microvirga]
MEQLALFSFPELPPPIEVFEDSTALARPDFTSYDYVLIAFSGGKDSLACLCVIIENLIEAGVPLERVELWHHDIDGREGSSLMDWPVTRAYCEAVAKAFGLKLYFSWREGGFEREMLRENSRTAPTHFETPNGLRSGGGQGGKFGTRRKFPQVSADLSVRWCSSSLKVDISSMAITNQDRFLGKRTLFVTGERAQESAARSKYLTFEPHRTDRRNGTRRMRHVDHWRPIHGWKEEQVWAIIEKFSVRPHPAYDAGFGRVSCMNCIFMSANQAATIQAFAPEKLAPVAAYEQEFGCTIHRTLTVLERAAKGTPYEAASEASMERCLSESFDEPMILPPGQWKLPAGAFGECAGPT